MPTWVAPQWEWYYWLWHDWTNCEQPWSFYFSQWPWTLIFGLVTVVGLVVAWRYSHSTRRQWAVIVAAGVWCFLLGHLYFPSMN